MKIALLAVLFVAIFAALLSGVSGRVFAGGSAMAISAEAMQGQSSEAKSGEGVAQGMASSGSGGSRSEGGQSIFNYHGPVSISDFSILSGPAIDPSSAPVSKKTGKVLPTVGYTVRHSLSSEYRVSETAKIGPAIGISQPFYGSDAGHVSIDDPQVKLVVESFLYFNAGASPISSNLWVSYFLPVSESSRSMHVLSSFSASLLPRLHLKDSRFMLSGLLSMKIDIADHPGYGIYTPGRVVAGVQGGYTLTQSLMPFMMLSGNTSFGPSMVIDDAGFGTATSIMMSAREGHPVGLMGGLMFHATRAISISPRVSWYLDQPLGMTTFGVNASFRLI